MEYALVNNKPVLHTKLFIQMTVIAWPQSLRNGLLTEGLE